MIEKIKTFIIGYVEKYNIDTLVLGISGGIDSCVCAAIIDNIEDIKLIGLNLPSFINKNHENIRAKKVGHAFCDEYKTISIDNIYKSFARRLSIPNLAKEPAKRMKKNKIRRGNLQARIRMNILYDTAKKNNGLVISTDNYTEYLLGFWTLHGDVGDLGIIQTLWKSEVYQLADALIAIYENKDKIFASEINQSKANIIKKCITVNATDGLGITKTDIDQIMPGWKDKYYNTREAYKEIDNILRKYINTQEYKDTNHPVIKRYLNTEFKRCNPENLPRLI